VADGFVFEDYLAVGLEVFVVVMACHGVSFVVVMLLAPLLRCGCFQCMRESLVCVPHSSDLSALVAGHLREVDTIRICDV
jgi:hypothetical protein